MNDSDDTRKLGAALLANRIKDEIEKDDNGNPDCSLNGTVDWPIVFGARESAILEMGIVIDITLTIKSTKTRRTERTECKS
jgi:hypothetical protein